VESAIFLFTRRVLAFFRVKTRLNVLIQPIFLIRSACFDPSSGQSRVNPGKQEGGGGGGAKKIKKSASFLFEVSCSQRRMIRSPQVGRAPASGKAG